MHKACKGFLMWAGAGDSENKEFQEKGLAPQPLSPIPTQAELVCASLYPLGSRNTPERYEKSGDVKQVQA